MSISKLKELVLRVPNFIPTLSFVRYEGKSTKVSVDFIEDAKPETITFKSGTSVERLAVKIDGKKGYVTGFDLSKMSKDGKTIEVGTDMMIKLVRETIKGKDNKEIEISVPEVIDWGTAHTTIELQELVK